MKDESLKSHRLAWFLAAAAGVIAALILAVIMASQPSGATAAAEPNSDFSVLESTSEKPRATLPEKAQQWLTETEAAGVDRLDEEPLVGLGVAQTQAGEVVVAELGEEICTYSVSNGLHTCASPELIAAGKGLVLVPGCPTSTVVGVLPDGFRSVEATVDGGKPTDIPVTSNVYVGSIESGDTTAFTATNGQGRGISVELPPGSMPDLGCKS